MLINVDQFPDKETKLFIPGPAGRIDALIDVPRIQAVAITAIICHPHPQMGGTMNNKVVTTTARALREIGVNTVCFNFRGAGQSEGSFAHGIGESDDLLAIVQWVQQRRPADTLWLAGFSFGSFVALRTINAISAQLLIAIAPPVHYPEFATLTSPDCPWVLVQGERDDVVNPAQVFSWIAQQPNEPVVIRLPDADHFFHGRLIELKAQLIATLIPFTMKGG